MTRANNHVKAGRAGAAAGAVALGWLVLSASPAFAANSTGDPNNIVQNSNFAAPVAPSASYIDFAGGSTSITGWTVGGNSVDINADNSFNVPPGDPTSTQTIDLSGYNPGSVSQVLTTVPGETYTGSIMLSANVNAGPVVKTGTLTVGSTTVPLSFDGTGMTMTTLTWDTVPFSFTATSTSTTLTIASTTAGDAGPLVTDVIVDPPTTVGTPMANPFVAAGGVAVLGLAGAGVVLVRRRRRGGADLGGVD
jgi:choice-of-anchor C domain-containing protein